MSSGPLFPVPEHPWVKDSALLTTFRSIQRNVLEEYYAKVFHETNQDFGSVTSDLSDAFSDVVAEDLVHDDADEGTLGTDVCKEEQEVEEEEEEEAEEEVEEDADEEIEDEDDDEEDGEDDAREEEDRAEIDEDEEDEDAEIDDEADL